MRKDFIKLIELTARMQKLTYSQQLRGAFWRTLLPVRLKPGACSAKDCVGTRKSVVNATQIWCSYKGKQEYLLLTSFVGRNLVN